MLSEDEHLLNVLACINANDKVCTQSDNIDIYRPTVFRGVIRWWYGENRAKNVSIIEQSVSSTMNKISLLLANVDNSSNIEENLKVVSYISRLLKAMHEATNGLDQLSETYRDDVRALSRIKILKNEIIDFLSRHNKCSVIQVKDDN